MKNKISVLLVSFLALCMHVMGQTQRVDGVVLSCNVVRSGYDMTINLVAKNTMGGTKTIYMGNEDFNSLVTPQVVVVDTNGEMYSCKDFMAGKSIVGLFGKELPQGIPVKIRSEVPDVPKDVKTLAVIHLVLKINDAVHTVRFNNVPIAEAVK